MSRVVLALCLVSRVTSDSKFQRHVNSFKTLRMTRSPSVPSEDGYVFNQFGDSSGMYAMFASENTKHNPYTGFDIFDFKTSDKLGVDTPHYADLSSLPDVITDRIPTQTVNPSKYNVDYEISKAKSDAKYAELTSKHVPSDVKSDIMIENLKTMMHYSPPQQTVKDSFSSYEMHNDYHIDDDDVRSSGRTMYDNYWPRIYHSPYEYEHKKMISDLEKAKDKRYVDEALQVKPVHEDIDNDIPNIDISHNHIEDSADNPIGGNGPFFSFVLNDYFDRNKEEDPLTFKGIDVDWGKEFDHESYRPSVDDIVSSKRDRRLKDGYYTPVHQSLTTTPPFVYVNSNNAEYSSTAGGTRPPITITPFISTHTYSPLPPSSYESPASILHNNYVTSEGGSLKEDGLKHSHDSDKQVVGGNKYSNHKTDYGTNGRKYEGFKNFLDSFANKFGTEDHKKDSNYENENNESKGQKKKGFHRVYHKDEFLEDNEFHDNSNKVAKAQEKGKSKIHIGGSEAFLGSQASASVGDASNTASKTRSNGDEKFEHIHNLHDGSNTKGNNFVKFIDVAKQAARSNNADYLDHFRV